MRNTAIKVTLEHVELTKFLSGQYAFSAKSLNKTAYSDWNTVQTKAFSAAFVQFHFHKALNKNVFR